MWKGALAIKIIINSNAIIKTAKYMFAILCFMTAELNSVCIIDRYFPVYHCKAALKQSIV